MTKRKPKSEHKKTGRPTILTKENIQKLEDAFSLGCTDLEACLYAGIGKSTLYAYQKENPNFLDRKELLKEKTILQARQTVVKALKNNPDIALKYLERKRKDEFGTKQEIDLKATTEVQHTVDVGKIHEILGNLGYSKKS